MHAIPAKWSIWWSIPPQFPVSFPSAGAPFPSDRGTIRFYWKTKGSALKVTSRQQPMRSAGLTTALLQESWLSLSASLLTPYEIAITTTVAIPIPLPYLIFRLAYYACTCY